MKKAIIFSLAALMTANAMAIDVKVASPDGKLQVTISDEGGKPTYVVNYDGKQMMTPSALGLNTNIVKLIRTGAKPLLLGFCCWVGITGVSLLLQHVMNLW